jgi:hypothetical protein
MSRGCRYVPYAPTAAIVLSIKIIRIEVCPQNLFLKLLLTGCNNDDTSHAPLNLF